MKVENKAKASFQRRKCKENSSFLMEVENKAKASYQRRNAKGIHPF
jgi:hypothetical protein